MWRRMACVSALVSCLAVPLAAASWERALERAQALIEMGDLAGARKELTAALAQAPSHPLLRNFLGVVEAQDGRHAEAEAHFREAVRVAPRYTDAHLNLGRLHQENAGRDPEAVAKALAAYEAVLAYEAGHAESLYQAAVLLQARGDFAASLERLARLPEDRRRRAQVLSARLGAEAGMGREEEAERTAGELLEHPGLTEADVLGVLPVLAARGREDLGLRLLERLRARGLASAPGLERLARAYESVGNLEAARDVLEAVAAARPGEVEPLLELARVAQRSKDGRGALGYLAHARQLVPGDARVHFLFGMVCVELDLGAEAYTSLKEAVRLDPGHAAANYALAAVALHRRDPSEAVPYFRAYAALTPGDPRGALGAGVAFFRAGDFDSARPELLRAAEAETTRAAARYFLARMAREENDLDAALSEVDRALAAQPAYADAWAERGLILLRRRDLEQAEAGLRRALELDRDNYLANLHLLALYQRRRDPRQEEQGRRVKELEALREAQAEEFRRVIAVRPR